MERRRGLSCWRGRLARRARSAFCSPGASREGREASQLAVGAVCGGGELRRPGGGGASDLIYRSGVGSSISPSWRVAAGSTPRCSGPRRHGCGVRGTGAGYCHNSTADGLKFHAVVFWIYGRAHIWGKAARPNGRTAPARAPFSPAAGGLATSGAAGGRRACPTADSVLAE